MRMFTMLMGCFLCVLTATAQTKYATVKGIIVDENDNPMSKVAITILGKNSSINSSDSGLFTIKVPAQKSLALIFSFEGYADQQKNFFLSNDETETIVIQMKKNGKTLETITIANEKERKEAGLIKINPKSAITLPSTIGGVEGLIKTLVGSNNELSSQYNVRGGNYDENLIYINDFEVYRPYLVSSGQQEGLSLINPALTRNINFYTGAFQSKYGDKMSSVLDIQYKKPTQFNGSVYASLLEQGLHLEGSTKNNRFNYLVGVRNKSNRNLLSSQPTRGAYIPSASDAQGLLSYKINNKLQLDVLGIYSVARFTFLPEAVKKTASVFSPFFTANIGLDVFFDGQEKDNYSSSLLGITLLQTVNKKTKLKWMVSSFKDVEKENVDIGGAYLFGDRDFDNASATFGQIINPLGAGYNQNYSRNKLNIDVLNVGHRGYFDAKKHYLQWGVNVEQTKIKDALQQFEFRDSAGYSLPYNPTSLTLYNVQQSTASLNIQKYSGFFQDNINISKGKSDINVQLGVRFNYNSLNKQTLISPRAQISLKPNGKKDVVFKLAGGVYNQPPFYRELRNYNGELNTAIKAQQSVQVVTGFDYNFKGPGNRILRLTSEAYYKQLSQVIPYDIDNVKIRYLGANNAKAYATGIELRLFGELVKDAESWVSVNFMRTKENINNDFYFDYKNAAGEIITATSTDQVVKDSIRRDVGFVRRPTDRTITVGMYVEDYLSTNKNFKVHLNAIYGSNMSYNVPNSVRYRNGLIIAPYIRVDMGFSALLLSEKSVRRSHSPFKNFDNIWASVEVFNLIDRANTISFQLIKDYSNTVYALPNRLTPRLVNFKIVAKF
ncbi:carboxypeptidase-like regulatory domain-containing protein [Ferruginibacter yonginensis]|uniref:Carboxypeptidase-like regulatory domain-containing protein n=1 Tax=Ferruginibacter yonginensis TaxID=1310416 RepID=A0ABV8QP82_9BACT